MTEGVFLETRIFGKEYTVYETGATKREAYKNACRKVRLMRQIINETRMNSNAQYITVEVAYSERNNDKEDIYKSIKIRRSRIAGYSSNVTRYTWTEEQVLSFTENIAERIPQNIGWIAIRALPQHSDTSYLPF